MKRSTAGSLLAFGRVEARAMASMMAMALALALAMAVVVGAHGCKGCKGQDDEDAILKVIGDAALAAQEHDIAAILDLTAPRFEASPGSRDREEVKTVLLIAFQHYGSFRIMYPQPQITVEADVGMATAEVPFIIVKEGGPVPDLTGLYTDPARWLEEAGKGADPYHLTVRLVKTDGQWLVERTNIEGLRSMDGM